MRILSALLAAVLLTGCAGTTSQQPVQDTAPETEAQAATETEAPREMVSWSADAVVYEVNIRQYTEEGTFEAFSHHLQTLKDMGINTLWLMPIHPISETNRIGTLGAYYSITDYREVNPEFGTKEDFKKLVDQAHEMGFYVMLDWVANHTGWDCAWIQDHPDWHTKDANGNITDPPGKGWKDELQLSHELWPEIRKNIKAVNPQAYILAEEWGDCGAYLQGSEWDSPMNYYGCGRVIRQFLSEPDLFMGRNPILRNVPYKMTAEDVKNRVMEHLAKMPYALQENQFNLFDSHDVSRLHNNPRINPDEYRGAVMFQFMLPGAASIYYGDEAGIGGVLDTNEGSRYPMPWSKDFIGTEAYRLNHTMAHAKAAHKALSHGGMKFLYAQGNVVALARFWKDEMFVAVISTADTDEVIRLPLGAVGAACPKGDQDLFDSPLEYEKLDAHSVSFTVKAHQSYFMECQLL